MNNRRIELSAEAINALAEAARAGAFEGSATATGGYTNYFKAMELLLFNFHKLEALVADEEAYCEVEYHAGRKTFAPASKATGYVERKTEADIVEEMQEDKRRHYRETKYGFERLKKAIALFEKQKEFAVVRLYYFGQDVNGQPRTDGATTWEEVVDLLDAAGILKDVKTARRWRNKIVNDMAVCIYGITAAASAATYRNRNTAGI